MPFKNQRNFIGFGATDPCRIIGMVFCLDNFSLFFINEMHFLSRMLVIWLFRVLDQ